MPLLVSKKIIILKKSGNEPLPRGLLHKEPKKLWIRKTTFIQYLSVFEVVTKPILVLLVEVEWFFLENSPI